MFLYSQNKSIAGEVKISQVDGMIDWNKAENYAEARIAAKSVEKLKQEAIKRRKQKDKEQITLQKQQEQKIQKKFKNDDKQNEHIDKNDENIKQKDDEDAGKYFMNPKQQNVEEKENIDYSNEIPDIPTWEKKNNNFQDDIKIKNSAGADYSLYKMASKVNGSINNPKHFAVFASEFAKVANGANKRKNKISAPEIQVDIEDYDTNEDEDPDSDYIASVAKSFGGNKNKVPKKYLANNNKKSRFYAKTPLTASEEKLQNISSGRTSAKKKTSSKQDVDFLKDVDFTNDKDIVVGSLEYKQSQAKSLSAPYPKLRDKTYTKTQIQPLNVSQLKYDKNNKHLQPAVFQKDLVEDVFSHLGEENRIPLARALIKETGNPNIADSQGNNMLMHAAALKDQTFIMALLSEGVSPNKKNNAGFSPLHLASSNGDDSAVYSMMLGGGDPNLQDNEGNTPLIYSVIMCKLETIKLLLSLGGNINTVNKQTQKTLLDYAKLNIDQSVASYIKTQINKINKNENTKDLNVI